MKTLNKAEKRALISILDNGLIHYNNKPLGSEVYDEIEEEKIKHYNSLKKLFDNGFVEYDEDIKYFKKLESEINEYPNYDKILNYLDMIKVEINNFDEE